MEYKETPHKQEMRELACREIQVHKIILEKGAKGLIVAAKSTGVNVEVHWTYVKELAPAQKMAWKKFWSRILLEDKKSGHIGDSERSSDPG